jgi:hypothetical protein
MLTGMPLLLAPGARVTRGGHHRKHVCCLAMDVYWYRVLLLVLPSNGLLTQNRSPQEGVYRAVA